MHIANSFHVDLPADQAWEVLIDVERIAPCMPGAVLESVDGSEFAGAVKVKVGSIATEYRGTARFVEMDAERRRVVLEAGGSETRGQGKASATVAAELVPENGRTRIDIATDLEVSGRVAQFGRGVMQDVSAKLIDQFATTLQAEIAGEDTGGQSVTADGEATAVPPSTDPIDLLAVGRGAVVKRLLPVAGLVALGVLVLWLLRRGRRDMGPTAGSPGGFFPGYPTWSGESRGGPPTWAHDPRWFAMGAPAAVPPAYTMPASTPLEPNSGETRRLDNDAS